MPAVLQLLKIIPRAPQVSWQRLLDVELRAILPSEGVNLSSSAGRYLEDLSVEYRVSPVFIDRGTNTQQQRVPERPRNGGNGSEQTWFSTTLRRCRTTYGTITSRFEISPACVLTRNVHAVERAVRFAACPKIATMCVRGSAYQSDCH